MSETASKPDNLPIGTLWGIPSKTNVKVTRPDGFEVLVGSDGKVAGHVLDVPGTYTAAVDGKTHTITAV